MSGLASRRRRWRRLGRVFIMRMLTVAAGVALVLQAANTGAQPAAVAPTPTYTEHVAPILQQRCGGCHRPDGIGPMALHTYQDARRHAFIIKSRVEQRVMPPWHLDRTVGIQEYKNDISLTDDQIATITRWVDAGAPEGDPALAPAPVEWSVGGEWFGLALRARFFKRREHTRRSDAFDIPHKRDPFTPSRWKGCTHSAEKHTV